MHALGLMMVTAISGLSAAEAKCPTDWYTVSGAVAVADGRLVSGAGVRVRWAEPTGTREIYALSDSFGRYSLRIPFDSFSENRMGGDFCNSKLEYIQLQVSHPGYEQQESTIKVSAFETTANPTFQRTAAPPLN